MDLGLRAAVATVERSVMLAFRHRSDEPTTSRRLLQGALAGAAATTALNAVTYLDMAWRGRPSSSTPQDTVLALANDVGVEVPGDDETRPNRLSGLGALMGIGSGIAAGVVVALVRQRARVPTPVLAIAATVVATTLSNAPMSALDVSHPTQWSAADWLSDLVPHLAYGFVVAAMLDTFPRAA
jgi:hypothetical protein